MAIIAGMDEAGYGPVLGPMIVTVVAFDVPDEKAHCSLWDLLKDGVSGDLKNRKHRLCIRDSKKLYNARIGLKLLEEAVLSFLWSKSLQIFSFRQLLDTLACTPTEILTRYPWYAGKDYALPVTSNIPSIINYTDLIRCVLKGNNVQFSYVNSSVLTVLEFNEQVRLFGNKSTVLFNSCSKLISGLWNVCGGNIHLTIDKQGGRSNYSHLLQKHFPSKEIKILNESGKISTYRVLDANKTMELSFAEKGEDKSMAAALASIFSKYIRELFMLLENQYWLQIMPELKPTAGYYEDAQRFLSQTALIRGKRAIHDDLLIRIK
jgi:ribonuclease HII